MISEHVRILLNTMSHYGTTPRRMTKAMREEQKKKLSKKEEARAAVEREIEREHQARGRRHERSQHRHLGIVRPLDLERRTGDDRDGLDQGQHHASRSGDYQVLRAGFLSQRDGRHFAADGGAVVQSNGPAGAAHCGSRAAQLGRKSERTSD